MRRVTLLAGIVLSFVVAGSALAATTRSVVVDDYFFSPATTTIVMGDSVRWSNSGVAPHTTTSRSALTWNRTLNAGQAYTYTAGGRGFFGAGVFGYLCTIHSGMAGKISVPIRVAPTSGPRGTIFRVRWATITAPTNYRYQAQKRNPGSTTWMLWKQTTAAYVSFATTSATPRGTYYFRARLLRWNGSSWVPSGWSVARGITVA